MKSKSIAYEISQALLGPTVSAPKFERDTSLSASPSNVDLPTSNQKSQSLPTAVATALILQLRIGVVKDMSLLTPGLTLGFVLGIASTVGGNGAVETAL